jgi:TRAP-type C4-dicarboxylate transport system substrate-binding protein
MKRNGLVLLVIFTVFTFVVITLTSSGTTTAAEKSVKPIVWKFASYSPPQLTASRAMKWFFDEIAKRSEGRFEPQYFWSASLVPPKQHPEALKSGLVQSTHIVPAYYPSKTPIYYVGNLPGLLPLKDGKEGWRTFMDIFSEWFETVHPKEEMVKWNAMFVHETALPFYSIMGRFPIRTIEDFQGKKIYAVGGKMNLLNKAGASAIFITMPELYDAVSKGVVNASAHAWASNYQYKIYELCDYWNVGINIGHINSCLAVNLKAYKALPKDIKKIFQEVKKEFPDVVINLNVLEKRKDMEAFEKAGIEVIEFRSEDNQKLREFAKEIWKETVEKLEKQGLPAREAFNSFQDIVKKHVPGYMPYHL